MTPARRYALVYGARDENEVAAYMPDNYRVEGSVVETDTEFSCVAPGGAVRVKAGPGRPSSRVAVVISGIDSFGWTLDTYVIPRLGSGLMGATEIDLSHPAMKAVPA